jgi:Asp-tRNA(Asn)/Glu-tRNA(Gln) amidotransferase A subunit family amidase
MTDLASAGPAGLNILTASAARERIARGEITSEQLVSDCLARIEARDPLLDAWAFLDPELALAQARACDREPARGPLHGIPVGIKDIYDTADMPTAYGTTVHAGHRPAADSEWIAALRAAGAVILGKTRTTEFANPYPTTTRNPHDPERTPGVSSAGSAAAVADFQVPLATGSQTGGSVIRPASLCGVYGCKPSFGVLPAGGVRHAKPSIDTPGLVARSLDDAALMIAASRSEPPPSLDLPAGFAPRIGVCRTDQWAQALPETVAMLATTERIVRQAGAAVRDVEFPDAVTDAMAEFWTLVVTEDVRAIAAEARDHLAELNPWSQKNVREASNYTPAQYENAKALAERARAACGPWLADVDVLITPATRGEASTDRMEIEPSFFTSVWTLMYAPCVLLPAFTGPAGMPVGLQVVGRRGADTATLAVAGWIERAIAHACGGLPAPVGSVP